MTKEANTLLLEIINKVASISDTLVIENDRISYKKNDLTKNKSISSVNHRISDTFNTQEYERLLTAILGSPTKFRESNDYTRKLIQTEIDQLSYDDFNLKTYLHKSISEGHNLHKLFPDVFMSFKTSFELLMEGKTNSQRGYMYKPSYKLKEYYFTILKILLENNYKLEFISDMTDEDAESVFKNYLTPEVVFDTICVILLKLARDNMFTQQSNAYDEKAMIVIHHQVIYQIYNHFSLVSILHSIHFMVIKTKKVIPLNSLLRSARNFMLQNQQRISLLKEYKLFIDGVTAMFQIFVDSGVFASIVKGKHDNNSKKDLTKYYFPAILSNQLGKYTQPPRVYRPEKITDRNLQTYIIPSPFSSTSVTAVKGIIDSLNISNNKRFSVNMNFVHILEYLENHSDLPINRPVPSTYDVGNCEIQLEKYTVDVNKFDCLFIDKIQEELSKRNLKFETTFQYRHMAGITTAESMCISDKIVLRKALQELKITRRGGNTRIIQSKILNEFPLYYTNQMCSTTRPFAREFILSRHIGCLKLLRGEYTSIKVTIKGLIHMMRAYYSDDMLLDNKFSEFLKDSCTKKPSVKGLKHFYESNRVDYSSKEAVTHFMLLSVELQKVFKTRKSKLLLQIDQVASGLVFMAVLFRNKELAIQTNLHYIKVTESPYNYAMKRFDEFYQKNIEKKNEKVRLLGRTSRKLHKYAMMCYSYNQTTYGRTEDFVTRWNSELGRAPSNEEWESLQEVSSKYPQFINELFPGLNTQIKLLDDIIEIVVKDSGSLRIRTLDGGLIEWKFYQKSSESRSKLNPHTLVPESYNLSKILVDKNGNRRLDLQSFKIKFLSYLVHSFDAGVMRQIICIMYQKHKYRVDQLFDCILLHPNQIDNFYQVIEEIYSQSVFDNYMNTHVFNVWRESISSDKYQAFDEKVSKFQKISEKCDVKKFKSNVYKMYTYEI